MTLWFLLAIATAATCAFLFRPFTKRRAFAAGGLVVLSFALYAYLGAPKLLDEIARYDADMAAIDARIVELDKKLQDTPDDVETLAALGQAYFERGEYSASGETYKKTVVLSEGDPLLILQYSKALIFAAGGTVTEDARKGLRLVRAMLPDNPEAQYFLALADVQDGNAERAMPVFKELYHELPEDSPIRQIIARQIGRE